MRTGDIITGISILFTFLTALAGLIISWRNSRKTIYINSVTASRVKWMESLRNNIAEFCGLIFHLDLTPLGDIDRQRVIEQIDKLRFLIKLQLNPKDDLYKKIIEEIDLIPNLTDPKNSQSFEAELGKLVKLTQQVLDNEWQWIKAESKYGELTEEQKRKILGKYFREKK